MPEPQNLAGSGSQQTAGVLSGHDRNANSFAPDRARHGTSQHRSPSSPQLGLHRPTSGLRATTGTRSALRPKSALPAFIADDKLLLRFFGYFGELLHWDEGPLGVGDKESTRIRKCSLTINVVENTMQIHEKAERNDGMLAGVFYKGRLPCRSDVREHSV